MAVGVLAFPPPAHASAEITPAAGSGRITDEYTVGDESYTFFEIDMELTTSISPSAIDPGDRFTVELAWVENGPGPLGYPCDEGELVEITVPATTYTLHLVPPGQTTWTTPPSLGDEVPVTGTTTEIPPFITCPDGFTGAPVYHRAIEYDITIAGDVTSGLPPGCYQPEQEDFSDHGVGDAVTDSAQGTAAIVAIGVTAESCEVASPECADNTNNDFDGLVDWPFDPGCTGSSDPSELGNVECDNGIDDDDDDLTDWPFDDSCEDALGSSEGASPECADNTNNDFDGLVDWPFDPGCTGSSDPSELGNVECDNGIDDDGDDWTDWPLDGGCADALDDEESDEVELAVRVDGPGQVSGDAGTCDVFCSRAVLRGSTVTVNAEPLEANNGFLGWVGCPSAIISDHCTFTITEDTEMTARFDPIVSYAPWIRFHPDERRWPMDPNEFVRQSSLRWTNVGSLTSPNGIVRPCTRKGKEIEARGSVDGLMLRTGAYRYRYCWRKVGRLSDGRKRRKTWTSRQLTSPSRKIGTQNTPVGGAGFYLDLANSARIGQKPTNDNGPPIYVEYEPDRYVIYWLFSGQNDVKIAGIKDTHEGDWEHIVVRLDGRNKADAVSYYQHLCGGDNFSWDQMRSNGFIEGLSHPKVYVARGAHASYPNTGFKPISCFPWVNKGVGDQVGSGLVWRTWAKGSDGFRRVDAQPWYGFGGGWGSAAGGSFWGPLGPGALKFRGGAAVPNGW